MAHLVLPPSAAAQRIAATHEVRQALLHRLATLAAASVQPPPEASPVWAEMRQLVLALAGAMPLLAGGVREALAQPLQRHKVPAASRTGGDGSSSSSASSGRDEGVPMLWMDVRPGDDESAALDGALLGTIYGAKGRPAAKVRKTRMKLGRDGVMREVPLADEDGDDGAGGGDDDEDEVEVRRLRVWSVAHEVRACCIALASPTVTPLPVAPPRPCAGA